jgi:hypothetical protein
MELLILIALTMWGTARYSANGAVAHARKAEPLRIAERRQRSAQVHERRMARMTRRGERSTPTIVEALSLRIAQRVAHPRGGPAREAFAVWWADSWGYATERRRHRHERAAAGELGRQRAARALRHWAAQQWRQRTAPPEQTDHHGRGRQSGSHQHHPEGDPVWADAEVIDDDVVHAEIVDDEPAPGRTTGQQPDHDPEKDQPTHTDPRPDTDIDPGQPAEPDHDQRVAATTPRTDPALEDERRQPTCDDTRTDHLGSEAPDARHTGGQLALVHPIRKGILSMSTHTVTSGETLDPAAGLAFVNSVGDAAEQILTQIELSMSALTGKGLTGEPIADLAGMQEAAQLLATRSRSAAGHFERHLNTQDQLLADESLAGTVEGTYVGTRS